MPKLIKRSVVFVKQESAQGTPATFAATDALIVEQLDGPDPVPEVIKRDIYNTSLDSHASLIGKNYYRLKFKSEVKGSGTPGTPYTPLGAALQACGMVQTVNAGVEAVGAAVADGANLGISPAPVIAAGTPAYSSHSGMIRLTLLSKTATHPEGATFEGIFYPNNGGAALVGQAVITDTAFSAVAFDGGLVKLTLTVNDPDAGGVGLPVGTWQVGDVWTFQYTSASEVSVVYAPTSVAVSSDFYGPGKSVTIECYRDGVKHVLAGALGKKKLTFEAGKIAYFEFEFMGVYAEPTDVSPGTQTLVSTTPPLVMGVALTLQSLSAVATNVSVDDGNVVSERPSMSAANSILGFMITGRQPTGSVDPEMVTVASHNFFNKLTTGAQGVMSLVVGSTAGNIVTFSWPKVQYTGLKYAERNGILALNATLQLNRNSSDDWETITFS